jgi:hypothetical protein
MAVSYPLSLPTSIGIAQIELSAENAVAVSSSPFTYRQQVVQHPGQRWRARVSIPPVRREYAEPWVAFLLALNGPVGTFLLGDPAGTAPRGSATDVRRNLLLWTEAFDQSAWLTPNASLTTVGDYQGIIPDGSTSPAELVQDTSAGQNISVAISVEVKATEPAFFKHVRFGGRTRQPTFPSIYVDTETGQTGGASSGIQNVSTQITADGWCRISANFDTLTGSFAPRWYVVPAQGFTFSSTQFAGNGTAALLVRKPQLEEGPAATTYQSIAGSFGPLVNGASQTGSTLVIDGASPSVTGWLLAGDYIQLGSGASATLHKVLTDVNTDASGNAVLDIWPSLRASPADNAVVTLTSPRGRFRLATNMQNWSINESSVYGLSFDAVEAI